MSHTRRREFITLLGGAAVARPARGTGAAAGHAGGWVRWQHFAGTTT
jgi:hypothetical protein